jgi:hypothetical protein
MRTKRPWLEQALTGLMRDHHRRLLTRLLAHIDVLDEPIDALSVEITRDLGATDFDAQRRAHLVDHVTRRLQRIGYHVHLEPVPTS